MNNDSSNNREGPKGKRITRKAVTRSVNTLAACVRKSRQNVQLAEIKLALLKEIESDTFTKYTNYQNEVASWESKGASNPNFPTLRKKSVWIRTARRTATEYAVAAPWLMVPLQDGSSSAAPPKRRKVVDSDEEEEEEDEEEEDVTFLKEKTWDDLDKELRGNAVLIDSCVDEVFQADALTEQCDEVTKTPDKQFSLLEITEGNVLSAGAVFVASIVLDALTALPTTLVVDVPTSMRTTALVLSALVAAPPVEADLIFEQRGLACVLLLATAFVGLHNGGVNARIADALYSLLCGWAMLLIFGMSGPKPGDRGHDAKGKRENVIALVAALLGYSGARIVRGALYHAAEVTSFSASYDDIESRGYALADDLVAGSLVFGGTLCVCAAAIILLNHDHIYEEGCEPVASVLAQISVLIFSSAFVVQVACYSRLGEMEALFGESACVGSIDVCENSYRARRLYTTNSSPAALWACAVGLTIFAFPYDRRCRTRRDYFVHPEDKVHRMGATGSGNVALVSAFVAVIVVYGYTDSARPAVELLLLFFSIPAAWYSSTWIACALHAAGMLLFTIGRLGDQGIFGFDFTFLTHWYVAATLLITVVLAITTFISWSLYASCCSTGRYIAWMENLTALLIVALISIQLFLTIASLAIISGYDGSLVSMESWRSASLRWVTQHSLGFFFAAALVGGRFECHNGKIEKWLLRLVWFAVPTLLACLWVSILIFGTTNQPYGTTGDGASIAIATLAALLPWGLAGIVMC